MAFTYAPLWKRLRQIPRMKKTTIIHTSHLQAKSEATVRLWQQEHAHKNRTLGGQDLSMKQVYSHEAQEH